MLSLLLLYISSLLASLKGFVNFLDTLDYSFDLRVRVANQFVMTFAMNVSSELFKVNEVNQGGQSF